MNFNHPELVERLRALGYTGNGKQISQENETPNLSNKLNTAYST